MITDSNHAYLVKKLGCGLQEGREEGGGGRMSPNIDSALFPKMQWLRKNIRNADQCAVIRERRALFTDLESGKCFFTSGSSMTAPSS